MVEHQLHWQHTQTHTHRWRCEQLSQQNLIHLFTLVAWQLHQVSDEAYLFVVINWQLTHDNFLFDIGCELTREQPEGYPVVA